jgi:hypothetical protein
MTLPGSKILDLLISMVLIYALLSLLVSVLLEGWNHLRKTRAVQLKASIFQLLNDSMNLQFGELFYNHFLIDGLRNKAMKRPPQYISSNLFAEVLIDIIGNRFLNSNPVQVIGQSQEQGKQYRSLGQYLSASPLDRFKNGLDQLNPSPFTDTLHSFFEKANKDPEKFKSMLAAWFDDYMDRTTGWYKSKQRNKLYFFGFLVAISLNVDSLHLVKMISLDDKLRSDLVNTADQMADEYNLLSDSAKKSNAGIEAMVHNLFPKKAKNRDFNVDDLKQLRDSLINIKPLDTTSYSNIKLLDSLENSLNILSGYQHRATQILNVATSLNIPIGWDEASAPLSWVNQSNSLLNHPKQIKTKGHYKLMDYLDKRNQYNWWSVFNYFIGILISGFSLSFGAPFWFEVLVKLVNIRRAGKKPEATNVK